MADDKKQLDKERVSRLIEINADARQYFFSHTSDEWFDWLLKNGFLDVIKQKAEEPTRFLPELEYVVKVATTKQKEVVDFMMDIDVPNNFNANVVSRFLWICASLDAVQLARIIPKMRDEQWTQRMASYNHWGFQYEKMFETLNAAKDKDSTLALAEVVLAVRPKEELGTGNFRSKDQPFYFDDLSQTNIFKRLNEMDNDHAEAAFKIVMKAFADVALLGGEKEDDVFPIGEIFALFDVDFFTISGGLETGYSPREEVKDLATTAKNFAERLIGTHCGSSDTIRSIYDKYIVPLPDARTVWRFRLFIWSLCPQVFKSELKAAFFRIFEVGDRVWPIAGGAEYERALQKGFGILDNTDQREYVKKILPMFEGNRAIFGYDIVSSIYTFLTSEEKNKAKKVYGKPLNVAHVPSASGGGVVSGFVSPQQPPNSDGEWGRSVSEIVELLKTKWTPKALREMDTVKDYLHPINAEGIANRLQEEIKKRPTEYINAANLFFDREHLDAHYTYSFLRGIAEALKAGKPESVDEVGLLVLFNAIISAGRQEPLTKANRRRESDTWLSDWQGVHDALADLLQTMLSGEADVIQFEKNRNAMLATIAYLLEYPDPLPEPYEPAKKNQFTGREEYARSDPFTEAINSVRGRAFQALMIFTHPDAKRFPEDAEIKLADDVKKLYENVLDKEETTAVMFLFGHYVAQFYYRDKVWMRPLLQKIFPLEDTKKDLMLAAVEGYLTTRLYTELFTELSFLYKRIIAMTTEEYTKRRYFGELDQTLSTHIALAYMHFDDFDTNSTLFKCLWYSKASQRRKELISFIGRAVISRERPKEWCHENGVKIEKIKDLWDWVLGLENWDEPAIFAEFGFWMNTQADLFDVKWLAEHTRRTLEKSNGVLDREYEMMRSMPMFVKIAPHEALAILKLYITATIQGDQTRRNWLHVDTELVQIFKDLYQCGDSEIKGSTEDFINWAVLQGGQQYWPLKEERK